MEDAKNSFVRNMVHEIEHPMETIVDSVAQIAPDQVAANEADILKSMLDNSNALLSLISNILHLSRLQSHITKCTRSEVEFAAFFESYCNQGWQQYQNADTQYVIESPYEQLVVDIDPANLGYVVSQLTALGALHTRKGTVRALYDYIGRRLLIAIDDTGEGMPPDILQLSNTPNSEFKPGAENICLAIIKETVALMGGTVEFSSEPEHGTTVYVSLPCHASTIRRKKYDI